MALTIYRLPADTPDTSSLEEVPAGIAWARLGEDVFVFAEAELPARLAESVRRTAGEGRETAATVMREALHVVVQNGRLFQEEHPEVPVLVDRGRFLVVGLDPKEGRRLREGRITAYSVAPLAENPVVFEMRAAAADRQAPVPWVQALVGAVERATLEASLKRLVAFPTRLSTSSHFGKAATWARSQLTALGYTTRTQTVSVNDGASRNVIADKRGSAGSGRRLVLVTAHLDSVNARGGAAAAAPGADDNGSGSAGLLEMARVLRAHQGRHDLRFILFGGEEQGLFGSRRYVSSLSATDRRRIDAVINMDMIGSLNSSTRSVLLEGAAVSATVIEDLGAAAATYTQLVVETSLRAANSDHVPFIVAGIPAVLTIEGADNTNAAIHTANDTINRIDHDLALEILRMNVAFVARALGRDGAP
jgi:Zn-dependent M28 family amino/carboxypeptidase